MPQIETEKNNKTTDIPQKKKWKLILLVFFLLLIGVIIFIWLKLQKPKSGEIRTANLTPAEMEKALPSFERFEGKYISFLYKSDYVVKSHNDTAPENGVIWETAFLSSRDINSTKIALTIESLENRKLTDVTGYNLRQMRPQEYRKENFFAGEFSGTAFTAIQSEIYEKVVFVEHNNYLAAIALTGSLGSDEEKDQELEAVIESIQWNK